MILAGSEGIDKIFSPENLGRDGTVRRSLLSNPINDSPHKSMKFTLTLLEKAVADSQAKLALITEVGTTANSIQHLAVLNEVRQKIETMESLLMQLRNQL